MGSQGPPAFKTPAKAVWILLKLLELRSSPAGMPEPGFGLPGVSGPVETAISPACALAGDLHPDGVSHSLPKPMIKRMEMSTRRDLRMGGTAASLEVCA